MKSSIAWTLILGTAICGGAAATRSGRASDHAAEPARVRVGVLTMQGNRLRDAGRYDEARRTLDEALVLAVQTFGPESLELAGVFNQLGMVEKCDGHFDEAETEYRRAIEIVERIDTGDHPLTAAVVHNLGDLEHARGRFGEGESSCPGWITPRSR